MRAPPLIDYHGGTWNTLAAWLNLELDRWRYNNDSPTLDAAATAAIRGRIQILKEILSLPAMVARAKETASADRPYGDIEV